MEKTSPLSFTRFLFLLLAITGPVAFCFLLSANECLAETRYIDNGDGTIKDTLTDLTWIKDPEKVPGLGGGMVWVKARRCCNELAYAGSGPGTWYLPNIKELQTLVEDVNRTPRFDPAFFFGYAEPYWSSTDDTGNGTRAWVVNFVNGDLMSCQKLSLINPVFLRARCVRKN
jgi:hypothetical protein